MHGRQITLPVCCKVTQPRGTQGTGNYGYGTQTWGEPWRAMNTRLLSVTCSVISAGHTRAHVFTEERPGHSPVSVGQGRAPTLLPSPGKSWVSALPLPPGFWAWFLLDLDLLHSGPPLPLIRGHWDKLWHWDGARVVRDTDAL